MAEIDRRPRNGFRVVSTFSGCGGSCVGYRMAGYEVVWASEFVPAAREVYEANKSAGSIVDGRDIRTVKASEILDVCGLSEGELDLLDGSPPCASFSSSGSREVGWGTVRKYSDTKQRVDDLFFEYVRILRGLQPKVFVAENVAGLVRGTAKGYYLEILRELKASGYIVKSALVDAQWLGVPQTRKRLVFVGVRNDLGRSPVFPKPLAERYTLRDALPWIDDDDAAPPIEPETDIRRFVTGKEWRKLRPGESSGKYFNLVRACPDRPSPCILASHGDGGIASPTHPFVCRKFSIAELKRICSFPADFKLTGTFTQQWERLGRAVPPLMMERIAATIRDQVLEGTI